MFSALFLFSSQEVPSVNQILQADNVKRAENRSIYEEKQITPPQMYTPDYSADIHGHAMAGQRSANLIKTVPRPLQTFQTDMPDKR
jgi:hypothetical protein